MENFPLTPKSAISCTICIKTLAIKLKFLLEVHLNALFLVRINFFNIFTNKRAILCTSKN